MKKHWILLIVIFSALILSGCGSTSQPTATPIPPTTTPQPTATPQPATSTPQPTATPIPPTATPQPTNTPLPPTPTPTPVQIKLTSEAFRSRQAIPEKYSCDSENSSPPLAWSDITPGTQSLALIVDDPDAVKVAGFVWVHWLVYNIPAETTSLAENVPADVELPDGSLQGETSFGEVGYGGPCPPQGKSHQYEFKLYALDIVLDLEAGITKEELLAAMEGHILAEGELIGRYKRK
jgi:Raf kinase inhibitor-like YbhB/YbcL family protein